MAVLRYINHLAVRPYGMSLAEWNHILSRDWEIPCGTQVSSCDSIAIKSGAQPHPIQNGGLDAFQRLP